MAKTEVTIKELLESGAHFGHQRCRWNPKMKRFVFEERNGIYIIDLAKTLQQIRSAVEVVTETVASSKSVLFVGTKKQAKEVMRECAERCGEFYVCERWLGGMLTNLSTIRKSVKKLERIEKKIVNSAEGLTKKELLNLSKDQVKLERNLSGIRGMRKPPGLLIVVDPSREAIAVAEANKLGIPVMALVDTNCDPDPIDYVIACNDDALKSIKLIVDALAEAIKEKKDELYIESGKEPEEKPVEFVVATEEVVALPTVEEEAVKEERLDELPATEELIIETESTGRK
ncbi:30S ribosomal protein S2 [Simkania negevensis]|uniref:Small ribosomal subunit protein uS2 n=1 Tax=Simkania negevensis TaxID=83561 RepID=A0ABS3AU54_9BACT|nr:30S ribosomal protein S2 [Simkania negevensis]